jgi:hypothetical protein
MPVLKVTAGWGASRDTPARASRRPDPDSTCWYSTPWTGGTFAAVLVLLLGLLGIELDHRRLLLILQNGGSGRRRLPMICSIASPLSGVVDIRLTLRRAFLLSPKAR